MSESKVINYTIRIPRSVRDGLRADAKLHSRSINKHFVKVIEQYLSGELVPVADLLSDPRVVNFAKAAIKSTK